MGFMCITYGTQCVYLKHLRVCKSQQSEIEQNWISWLWSWLGWDGCTWSVFLNIFPLIFQSGSSSDIMQNFWLVIIISFYPHPLCPFLYQCIESLSISPSVFIGKGIRISTALHRLQVCVILEVWVF